MKILLLIKQLLRLSGLETFGYHERASTVRIIYSRLICLFLIALWIPMLVFTIQTNSFYAFLDAISFSASELSLALSYMSLLIYSSEITQFHENFEKAINSRMKISPLIEMVYIKRNTWVENISKYWTLWAIGVACLFYVQWFFKAVWIISFEGLQSDKLKTLFPLA